MEGPVKPPDVAASFFHALGLDPQTEYHTPSGQPVRLVREGKVIGELFA